MRLGTLKNCLLAGLVLAICLAAAPAAASPGPSSGDGCRDHGAPADGSPILEAMPSPGVTGGAPPARVAADPDDGEPKSARKDDGGWDIGGNFGPVRTVKFTTDEGTWMNLDVHPDGDLIVFDLLGDLYTLPVAGGKAKRITEGSTYDYQPRFSPDGKRLLFTSDRGGGMNIWVASFEDGELGEPKELVEEKSKIIDGAAWDPSGEWIYARKRTTDTSSLGVSEVWSYHVDGGSGVNLVEAADSGEVDGFSATRDGRYLYVGTAGGFSYGRDPYGVIWSVRRYDRKRGELDPVSVGFGSSAVPRLSPDEKTLAFIRRVEGKSTLWLHDIASGAERQVWDGLDRDQLEAFATHGAYPGYAWTPDGQSLVIWAQGGFFRISPSADPVTAERIPFEAEVEQRIHQVLRDPRPAVHDEVRARIVRWPVQSPDGTWLAFQALGRIYRMDLPDGRPSRLTDSHDFELSPAFSTDGKWMAWASWSDETGGTIHRMRLPAGDPVAVYAAPTQLANPSFSPDGKSLVFVQGSGAHLRGQDLNAESRMDLMVIPAGGGEARFLVSTSNRGPQMRITRPVFGPEGRRVYYFEDLPGTGGGARGSRTPQKVGLVSVDLDGDDRKVHLSFRYAQEAVPSPDGTHVAFTELHNAYVIPMPGVGKTLDIKPGSIVPVAQLSWDGGEWVNWADGGATVTWSFGPEFHRMAMADLEMKAKPGDRPKDEVEPVEITVDAKGSYSMNAKSYGLQALREKVEAGIDPENKPKVKVTVDEKAPFSAWKELKDWLDEKHLAVEILDEDEGDEEDGGEGEPEGGEEEDKKKPEPEVFTVDLRVPRARPEGVVAFTGARIITMKGDEVIEDGTVVVTGDRISAVGRRGRVRVPSGARVIDVSGKTIIPGLVDVHAHMGYGVLDISPQKEWRYYANLAYGVTTTHDPSASTHLVFGQGEMVEAGIMVGPRIFSTGFILYGATIPDMAPISSYADALSHVRRLKSLGAFSVKSYMQPRREQRQWVMKAAREEGMLVFPEGGGDFEANMGMILDGHTGIEHALSVGPIYKDVVTMFAESGVGYTPTLLVAYGGIVAENWFYQHHEVWRNEKLQSFFPPRMIDARARRREMAAEDDFNYMTVAAGGAKIVRAGGLVNLGAHGQLQGLGAHWEMWAFTHGGMTPHEALKVATINGARYLGMEADLGSIEPGKLADMAILDRNPLEKIENSDSVAYTVINGTVYESDTMNGVWPEMQARGKFPFEAEWPRGQEYMAANNPLLADPATWGTPFDVLPLDRIRDEHYRPAFELGMEEQEKEIEAITSNPEPPTFENTIESLERSGSLLNQARLAFYPRNAAHTNDHLQALAREIGPELSAHDDDIAFNKALFKRVEAVYGQRDSLGLTPEQMRLLEETRKQFIRSGVNLPEEAQERIREINGELATLSARYDENLLAETNDFELVLDEDEITGLPEGLVTAAAEEAERRGKSGKYVFTLQRPSINPFLQYSPLREKRKALFEGYAMRGDKGNEHDNKEIAVRMAELRAERANLLGYETHAHYILEDRMAETPERVYELMDRVWRPALEVAKREAAGLEEMMHQDGIEGDLHGADWRYYTEKIRQERYALDDELLRPYLEVSRVRDGAFRVANKLWGITFQRRTDLPVWHPDQEAYEVREADGTHIGVLYMDFFTRPSKRGGAWMNDLRVQSNLDGRFVHPVVTTNFNFPPPTAKAPSLLNFTEASTLFHELGHAFHGLLSSTTYESLSGTNVAWDFVEFPSQVMENWMAEPEVLRMFARHHQTGEPMPDDLIEKIRASAKFNQGFITVEYMAAAYLDMNWHTLRHGQARISDPRKFESEAMESLGLIDEIIPRYRSTYFSHIFAGGYSSGYYSYLWSEVLDADAFEAFKEAGLFDQGTAAKYRTLLSRGGTRPGMELYREFRGRDPEIAPLLERRGLTGEPEGDTAVATAGASTGN